MSAGGTGEDWIALSAAPLPVGEALSWAVTPSCGAVVTFAGTVRDNSPGRPAVRLLEYEAYEQEAIKRLAAVAAEARHRWPQIGRIALLHRTGALEVTMTAVVVVVSTPGRAEAFAAARYCIDTVKATVPIWKRETWEGGSDWSEATTTLGAVAPGYTLDLHDHDHDEAPIHDGAEVASQSARSDR